MTPMISLGVSAVISAPVLMNMPPPGDESVEARVVDQHDLDAVFASPAALKIGRA